MATTITRIDKTKILTNLDTYNHTTLLASMYVVQCQVNEIPPSGITITIQKNGSTAATVSAPASSQQLTQLRVVLNCALSDVISVILASSTPSDTGPNAFKAQLNIHPGAQ